MFKPLSCWWDFCVFRFAMSLERNTFSRRNATHLIISNIPFCMLLHTFCVFRFAMSLDRNTFSRRNATHLLISNIPFCMLLHYRFLLCLFWQIPSFLRLLPGLGPDGLLVEELVANISANESFAISRERSISAPDVYRSRIINGGTAALVSRYCYHLVIVAYFAG